jgi:hypothetical protein
VSKVSINEHGVSFRHAQANRKLSPVNEVQVPGAPWPRFVPKAPFCCSTYVSIEETCPSSCAFKGNGCFAQSGYTGSMIKKLDLSAQGRNVGLEESKIIDRMWPAGVPQDGARGGRDLRLHVAGDAKNARAARDLAGAAQRWLDRGGGLVWTYTHRWRAIPREAWGRISVLASTETAEDASEAIEKGYAASIVVRSFPNAHRAFTLPNLPGRVIPCPAEAGKMTCVECRLCFDDEKLLDRELVIGFAAHGTGVVRAKRKLPVFAHDEPLLARVS